MKPAWTHKQQKQITEIKSLLSRTFKGRKVDLKWLKGEGGKHIFAGVINTTRLKATDHEIDFLMKKLRKMGLDHELIEGFGTGSNKGDVLQIYMSDNPELQ